MRDYQRNAGADLLPARNATRWVATLSVKGGHPVPAVCLAKGWLQGTQSHLDFFSRRATPILCAVLAEEFGLVRGCVCYCGVHAVDRAWAGDYR
jgi:rod shape determining protein RodA